VVEIGKTIEVLALDLSVPPQGLLGQVADLAQTITVLSETVRMDGRAA
jgi:hypothetical protein